MKLTKRLFPTGKSSVIEECYVAWHAYLQAQENKPLPTSNAPDTPYLAVQPEGPVCYLGNLHPVVRAQI